MTGYTRKWNCETCGRACESIDWPRAGDYFCESCEPPRDGATQYGFRWGPAEVSRLAGIERSYGGQSRVLGIKTPFRELEIYVSPTGRSVRVFEGGEELGA